VRVVLVSINSRVPENSNLVWYGIWIFFLAINLFFALRASWKVSGNYLQCVVLSSVEVCVTVGLGAMTCCAVLCCAVLVGCVLFGCVMHGDCGGALS
jgi:hypothetical protein